MEEVFYDSDGLEPYDDILYQMDQISTKIPRKDLEVLFNDWRRNNAIHTSQGKKVYIPFSVGLEAYKHTLETNCTPKDALTHAINVLDEDSRLEEGLNSKFYFAKHIIDAVKEHPKQVRIASTGVVDPAAIKTARTLNQQLRRLRRYINIAEEIYKLKAKVEEQDARIKELEASVTIHDQQLTRVEKELNITVHWQDKASALKEAGFSKKDIAKKVGKSYSTIRRVWEEL